MDHGTRATHEATTGVPEPSEPALTLATLKLHFIQQQTPHRSRILAYLKLVFGH